MGFNLGLAAAAYQGVKAEQRRLRDDEFTKAQNDYALARLEEHASRRKYRDNEAAGADEAVTAQRGLLPQKTKVEELRLDAQEQSIPLQTEATVGGLQSTIKDQKFSEGQRNVREETAAMQGQTGLVAAQNAKDDADDVRAWGPVRRLENSLKIEHAIAQQPQRREEFQDDILAGIFEAGDGKGMEEKAIIHRINGTTGSRLFPELYGKTVGDIKLSEGNAELYDDKGKLLMSVPQQRMKAAYEKKNPGKVQTVADGTNLYSVSANGKAATPLTNNKKSFNPNAGLSGAGGRAAAATQLEKFAADLVAEAKAKGKTLSMADAKRNALAEMKADPAKLAGRILQANILFQTETDPDKQAAMRAQALETAMGLSAAAAGRAEAPASGLSAASPKTQALVGEFLKP